MADRIASFLFEHAIVLVPAVVVTAAVALFLLARHWPRTLGRRLASGSVMFLALAIAALASGLLYAERNIRSILEHRVRTLSLQTRNGAPLARVADLKGEVVVLNFWATWCGPCRAEMPDLNRLSDRYAARHVTVLAITDEPPDRIALFEKKVLPLRMRVATFRSEEARGGLAAMAYGGRPTTVVLDRDGEVKDIFIGRQSYERLSSAIDDLL